MNGWKNLIWKVSAALMTAAAITAAGFAGTRASNEDVEHVEKEIQELRVEVNHRLRNVETNVIKTCQFLDRQ
ncbi:unnamed protein product, partial [marine sediment metagenome]